MNCIDFRRHAVVQPLRLGDEALAHAAGCTGCEAFIERQRQLDADLLAALQVPAPDGLAERIVLAQGIRRRHRPWAWAAAASVLVASALAIVAPPYFAGNALAGEAIAHVKEEPQSFRLVSRHAPEFLPGELAAQGIRLAAALGEVTYTQICPMREGKARHIVVATARGPVTLLLMPGDSTARRRASSDAEGLSAITLPAARGSIAIVASNRQHALEVERLLVLS
jgi:hypothetical protein